MAAKSSFLKQFWKQKKMIGAMAPSSRFLASKMLQNVDLNAAKVLVELGPGTGVFTHEIIEKMPKSCTLLVFELNEDFVNNLQKSIADDRVHIIHDSAAKIQDYLNEYALDKADAIISSLPLANFPKDLRLEILQASYNALKKGGNYIQFQYSLQSKKQINAVFDKVTIDFTPLNFPPAFIYTCEKSL